MKLSELNAKIIHIQIGNDSVYALLFDCPVKCGYQHMIPYWDKPSLEFDEEIKVWHRTSGSTIEDLSLTPSYVSPIKQPHIHTFVINGELQGQIITGELARAFNNSPHKT